MNEHQNSLKKFSKIAAITAVILFIQLQFGCSSLIKSVTSSNSNGSSPTVSENGKNTGGSSDSSSKGASEICRNAYYPVGPNVERTYHIKYEKLSNLDQDYTEKYADFSNDSFVSNTLFKEVNTTINWRCLPEGLLSTQYGNSIQIKDGNAAKIDTVNSSGVSFPAESRWNPGEKWASQYDIKQSVKNAGGQAMDVDSTGTVNQNGEIIGTEEVTVPAGTFEAVKVKVKTTLDLTVKVGKMTIPTKTNVETTGWFAKDVGMVKSQTSMAGIDSATSELLSYAGTK